MLTRSTHRLTHSLGPLITKRSTALLATRTRRHFATSPPVPPAAKKMASSAGVPHSSASTSNILADVKSDLSLTLDPTGKDVTQIIVAEHALVKSLSEKWETTTDVANKQGIAYNMLKLLSTHAAKEEMAVYPAIRAKLPNGPAIADHALNEHLALKKVLYELDSMKVTDPGFDGKLKTAVQLTLEHVSEEENEILPLLKKTLSAADLDKVTHDYTTYAAVAPTRPHPDAPNQPPANIAANTATVPLDMARDIGRFQSASTTA